MKKLILIIYAIVFFFTACKKEEGCMDPSALNYNADSSIDNGSCYYESFTDITIYFQHFINAEEVIMNDMIYTNQSNIDYSVQRLRYLISNIKLTSNKGEETILNEVHFIDISIDSTLTLNIPNVNSTKNYTSISFTMGLDSIKNKTNLFLNESFFPSFLWPDFLGGGYHYMQLEGDFNTVFNGYTTHTGGTNGIDFSFNKTFPFSLEETNSVVNIYINMELTNWYNNPEIFNLTADGIMGDVNKQAILKSNGIEDVFSINF